MTLTVTRSFNIDAGILSSVVALGAFREACAAEEELPQQLWLTGVVRDFQERTADGGHPDFEVVPDHGYGHYVGNVALALGDDGKPVFTGTGRKVSGQTRDQHGHQIAPHMFNCRYATGDSATLVTDESLDDKPGSLSYTDAGGIESAESFDQWYRDELGVNMSAPLTIQLDRQPDGVYVFDDSTSPEYAELGGFFPIEGRMFGNPGGHPDRNFHFTFELHTQFTYDAGGTQFFKFIGDDDVWVYIDGKLAIDLGGVHGATEQYVDLNRLGLVDGETYDLDFFFAERHRTESNVRIETNLALEPSPESALPTMTAAFD